MKKDKLMIFFVLVIGILIGMIFMNILDREFLEAKNSLDLNIEISQGKQFIQIDNQSNLPENGAIIDYDGSISKKLEINQTK